MILSPFQEQVVYLNSCRQLGERTNVFSGVFFFLKITSLTYSKSQKAYFGVAYPASPQHTLMTVKNHSYIQHYRWIKLRIKEAKEKTVWFNLCKSEKQATFFLYDVGEWLLWGKVVTIKWHEGSSGC